MIENYLDIIAASEIMRGIEGEEITSVLSCLRASVASYPKGCTLYREGDKAYFMGVVLSGAVSVSKTDFYGNKNIIIKLPPKGIFAETAAFSSDKLLPFCIEAESDCKVLMINTDALTKTCCNNCRYHRQLIDNVISAIANTNIEFVKKINILTARTIREKILELLNINQKAQKSRTVALNMSRQEMADYLSVDRSALSRELGLLKRQGVIDYHKNIFRLI